MAVHKSITKKNRCNDLRKYNLLKQYLLECSYKVRILHAIHCYILFYTSNALSFALKTFATIFKTT